MANRCADNVIFVQCILPHREYLFSKVSFSPKITHEGKKLRWMYIRDQLVASGLAHFVGKDDSYMRQKWADMKRRTIEKLSRLSRNGQQNPRANLSEVDTLILRIIGDNEIINADQQQIADSDCQPTESNHLNLPVALDSVPSYYETEQQHMLLNNQHQNLAQHSVNLMSTAKSEPANAFVCGAIALQQESTPQIVPPPPTSSSSSAAHAPLFHTTVTENGILLPPTLRRKRKKFILKRANNSGRISKISSNRMVHCPIEKQLHKQQQQQQLHPMENGCGDLDEQIKRAKLAYYKSQIDLNNALKSESTLRRRFLTLQIEQIQQEIAGDDEDILEEEQ